MITENKGAAQSLGEKAKQNPKHLECFQGQTALSDESSIIKITGVLGKTCLCLLDGLAQLSNPSLSPSLFGEKA